MERQGSEGLAYNRYVMGLNGVGLKHGGSALDGAGWFRMNGE